MPRRKVTEHGFSPHVWNARTERFDAVEPQGSVRIEAVGPPMTNAMSTFDARGLAHRQTLAAEMETVACRYCGRGVTMAEQPGRLGWRTCSDCLPVEQAEPEVQARRALFASALVGEPVGPTEIAEPALAYFEEQQGHDYGTPAVKPWQWVDRRKLARVVLAVRKSQSTPVPSPGGRACSGCGVALSLHWTQVRGRLDVSRIEFIFCADCRVAWLLGGQEWGEQFADHLLARALGFQLSPCGGIAHDLRFSAFADLAPDPGHDPSARFSWISEEQRTKARWYLARRFPGLCTPEERAQMERQFRMEVLKAEMEPPPKPPVFSVPDR